MLPLRFRAFLGRNWTFVEVHANDLHRRVDSKREHDIGLMLLRLEHGTQDDR